jgi:hypothetical protein
MFGIFKSFTSPEKEMIVIKRLSRESFASYGRSK